MQDKRVLKTKSNIKRTMRALVLKKNFEEISVKELCELAQTSRITFYNYYGDKYDLMDEIFRDLIDVAATEFRRLQKQNNPENADFVLSFENLIDSFLYLYSTDDAEFFAHITLKENTYLYYACFRYILNRVEQHFLSEKERITLKYPLKATVSFICNGLWSFISECRDAKMSIEQIRQYTREIVKDLVLSGVLTEKNQ